MWKDKTKTHEIPAVVTNAVPTKLNQCRVNKNQAGLLLGVFIVSSAEQLQPSEDSLMGRC
jgi:hypothetical protein